MLSRVVGRPVLLAALCGFGCGADAGGPETPPDFTDAPAREVASASGGLVATVRSSPPQPSVGVNAVQLRLVDAGGAPVDDAALTATPWMPAHGHGASVAPSVTARGGGVYEIDRVYFFMPGRWELRSEIAIPGQVDDLVLATFDVR